MFLSFAASCSSWDSLSSSLLSLSYHLTGIREGAKCLQQRQWRQLDFIHSHMTQLLCIDVGRIWVSTRDAGEKMLCNAHSKWDGQPLHCALYVITYVGSRTAECTRPSRRRNIPLILTPALWPACLATGKILQYKLVGAEVTSYF